MSQPRRWRVSNAVAEDGVRQPEVGIKRTLLDERQDERAPAPADAEAGRLVAGRQRAIRAGIVVQGQGELMQIVLALRASRGFTHFLNGRKEKRDQQCDNRDHDEQFDQRKRRTTGR